MVSVRFKLYMMLFTKQSNFYLPKVKFHALFARSFLCWAAHSFVLKSDTRISAVIEMKRFSLGLRNTFFALVCEILALNLLFALGVDHAWEVNNRFHVQSVHTSFGRFLTWSEIVYLENRFVLRVKAYVYLCCLAFKEKEWPNGKNGIHQRVWRTNEEKEEIQIHEELMIIQLLRWQRDKNFNLV